MNILLRVTNYITRYAPSEKRIRGYLTRKKCQNIDILLSDIGYSEVFMCRVWMKTLVALGKWERDIKMKLMKKDFPKEVIASVYAEFSEEVHDWEANRQAVEIQIRTLDGRGKSKQAISSLLSSKYPYFRDEIRTLLEWSSDEVALEREIEKYRTRYNLSDPKEKQKFYAAILRKGFKYDDIKRMMRS